MGQDYAGQVAVTQSGLECQAWASQSPHSHSQASNAGNFPEGSLEDAKNYCRNPGGSPQGPWCYTVSSATRFEYCDIPVCEGSVLHIKTNFCRRSCMKEY